MDREIPPVTRRELRKAAMDHTREMIRLKNSIRRVTGTAARLTAALDQAGGAPAAGGARYDPADVVMGELLAAYRRVASLFDHR